MARYYRVLKDTPLWVKGAIISNKNNSHEYLVMDEVWEKVELKEEYLTAHIIEDKDNGDFFERVYPIGDLKKKLFGSKLQAQAAASVVYKDGKKNEQESK